MVPGGQLKVIKIYSKSYQEITEFIQYVREQENTVAFDFFFHDPNDDENTVFSHARQSGSMQQPRYPSTRVMSVYDDPKVDQK